MLAQRWMWIAWPAFLAAAVMEMLVFAFVDPLELHWLGDLGWSRQESTRWPSSPSGA